MPRIPKHVSQSLARAAKEAFQEMKKESLVSRVPDAFVVLMNEHDTTIQIVPYDLPDDVVLVEDQPRPTQAEVLRVNSSPKSSPTSNHSSPSAPPGELVLYSEHGNVELVE